MYKEEMQIGSLRRQRCSSAVAWFFLLLPAAVFYFQLWRTAVPLPILDDYQIILGLLNGLHDTPTLAGKAHLVFVSEHNGYKLVFENLCVAADHLLVHPFSLPLLIGVGDALAALILATVLAMPRFRPDICPLRWWLMVPAAALIMQLQYASALNFASSSLQHLAVIFFSLLAMLLLAGRSRVNFAAACAALMFAAASSPNGFFAVPPGFLMLAQRKRWSRAAMWVGAAAVFLLAYLYRYQPDAVVPAGSRGPRGHINLAYALSFLGAAAARYTAVTPSVLLGVLLCGVFIWATVARYYRTNPPAYYSMLFILLNALAISSLRADQGVSQSLASRYRLYSALLLAFSYLFLVERWYGAGVPARFSRTRRIFMGLALATTAAFAAVSDIEGTKFLQGKKEVLIYAYRVEWLGQARALLAQPSNPVLRKQLRDGVFSVNLTALRDAVRNDVYVPPRFQASSR